RGFSLIAKPLTNLTRKSDEEFEFTPEAEEAMNRLKKFITEAPVLKVINYESASNADHYNLKDNKLPGLVILAVDSCQNGAGWVIFQNYEDGRHPILYGSCTFNNTESKYSQAKLELYGLFRAIKDNRHHLWGLFFLVEVDAKFLIQMINSPDLPNAPMTRWVCFLQLFHFKIHHVPGTKHIASDGLSRRPHNLDEDTDGSDAEQHLDRIIGYTTTLSGQQQLCSSCSGDSDALGTVSATKNKQEQRKNSSNTNSFELSCATKNNQEQIPSENSPSQATPILPQIGPLSDNNLPTIMHRSPPEDLTKWSDMLIQNSMPEYGVQPDQLEKTLNFNDPGCLTFTKNPNPKANRPIFISDCHFWCNPRNNLNLELNYLSIFECTSAELDPPVGHQILPTRICRATKAKWEGTNQQIIHLRTRCCDQYSSNFDYSSNLLGPLIPLDEKHPFNDDIQFEPLFRLTMLRFTNPWTFVGAEYFKKRTPQEQIFKVTFADEIVTLLGYEYRWSYLAPPPVSEIPAHLLDNKFDPQMDDYVGEAFYDWNGYDTSFIASARYHTHGIAANNDNKEWFDKIKKYANKKLNPQMHSTPAAKAARCFFTRDNVLYRRNPKGIPQLVTTDK
ncbi:MAG: Ty3/Gypsy family RNase HI domain-containing protein, partial [Candidatus Saccharimonadales bacterium]